MIGSAKKLRAIYEKTPYVPFFLKRVWFLLKNQGKIDESINLEQLFGFDPPGSYEIGQLG